MKFQVIKRDKSLCDFNADKINIAILKAMKNGSGIVKEEIAFIVTTSAEEHLYSDIKQVVEIKEIEDYVYSMLIKLGEKETAKAYEGYRAVQEFKRKNNTSDNNIMNLINLTDKDLVNENSNKNAYVSSTQRDLIAGEVSKDIAKRKIIPAHIVQAHDNGVIHYHNR